MSAFVNVNASGLRLSTTSKQASDSKDGRELLSLWWNPTTPEWASVRQYVFQSNILLLFFY
jgi:hypothetical protein